MKKRLDYVNIEEMGEDGVVSQGGFTAMQISAGESLHPMALP